MCWIAYVGLAFQFKLLFPAGVGAGLQQLKRDVCYTYSYSNL